MAGIRLSPHAQHTYLASSVKQSILVELWSAPPLATPIFDRAVFHPA